MITQKRRRELHDFKCITVELDRIDYDELKQYATRTGQSLRRTIRDFVTWGLEDVSENTFCKDKPYSKRGGPKVLDLSR